MTSLSDSNKTVFRVEWLRLYKALCKFMAIAFTVPMVVFIVLRLTLCGFDTEAAFKNLSLPVAVLILAGGPVMLSICAFPIAFYFKWASITLTDTHIEGRSYWGMRNRVPLEDIVGLAPFSSNGINAVVVESNTHGKIYISDHTECLDDLVVLLATYVPEERGLREPA